MALVENRSPSVLLVDDNRDFVKYTARRLEARKMCVDTAFDGEEALNKVRTGCYDVIVLDILMPGMTGIDTLKEIKKLDSSALVVLLTGHGTEETAAMGKRLGAFDYLLKPAEFGSLLEAIERAVRCRREAEADAVVG